MKRYTSSLASADSSQKEKEENLIVLFFTIGRLLKSGWAQDADLLPSFLHMETLRFVEEREDPTMNHLAGYLKVAAPTVTSLVNSLVEDALLSRRQDPLDRRCIRLTLTAEGERILERTCVSREKAFETLLQHLSPTDRKTLTRILTTIVSTQTP